MALKVTPFNLWTGTVEDRPGGAAAILEPLAKANVDLGFVLVRRATEVPGKGLIFVAPIKDAKAEAAAKSAGLSAARNIAGLRVEGDNKPGAGYAIVSTIADAGISFRGLSAAVFGKSYVCHLAFDSESDARRAAEALVSTLTGKAKK